MTESHSDYSERTPDDSRINRWFDVVTVVAAVLVVRFWVWVIRG